MPKISYSYVDYYLGILAIIFFIIYISLVSTDRYINKNSPQWSTISLDDKKYVGYTNMLGNLFMIFVCGFDGVVFAKSAQIYLSRYVGKLIILLIFIGISYDVVLDNSAYGKFNAALQPLVGYLQVLSIGTIVQIITKLDLKLHTNKTIISDTELPRPRVNSLDTFFGMNEKSDEEFLNSDNGINQNIDDRIRRIEDDDE